jgi:hypothetical protein
MRGLRLMAKRRESKRGTSKAEVRLAGWGSSLPGEGMDSSPRPENQKTLLWSRAWEAPPPAAKGDHPEGTDERIVQVMARNDRRHHQRTSQAVAISIQQFSPNAALGAEVVSATVQNLSRGGICIASPVPFMTSSVVQCQIGVPDLEFAIPTLMQVVWFDKLQRSSQYAVGLRYLL